MEIKELSRYVRQRQLERLRRIHQDNAELSRLLEVLNNSEDVRQYMRIADIHRRIAFLRKEVKHLESANLEMVTAYQALLPCLEGDL